MGTERMTRKPGLGTAQVHGVRRFSFIQSMFFRFVGFSFGRALLLSLYALDFTCSFSIISISLSRLMHALESM